VVDIGKRCHGQRIVITERQYVIGSLTLIQPYTTVLHTCLEGVTAARPDQIVDHAESGSDLDVGAIVIKGYEIISAHLVGQCAGLRIMEGCAIEEKLPFIEKSRPGGGFRAKEGM